jgi:Zn-dependent protease with chaperone function
LTALIDTGATWVHQIAVFTGLLTGLHLTDDETAVVLGHETAHALREHARSRIARSEGTATLLSLAARRKAERMQRARGVNT